MSFRGWQADWSAPMDRVWSTFLARTLLLFTFVLAGCGPSPELIAKVTSGEEIARQEALAKKITWAEYARRSNALRVSLGPSRFNTPQAQAFLAYRVMLGAAVDAGQISPDQFDYLWKQRLAQIGEAEDAARTAAANNLVALGAAIASGGNSQSSAPTMTRCSTDTLGTSLMTRCRS